MRSTETRAPLSLIRRMSACALPDRDELKEGQIPQFPSVREMLTQQELQMWEALQAREVEVVKGPMRCTRSAPAPQRYLQSYPPRDGLN